jgi:hypothetical protein
MFEYTQISLQQKNIEVAVLQWLIVSHLGMLV